MHKIAVVDPKGVLGMCTPLSVQILSFSCSFQQKKSQTRMHSSRMRTVRCSDRQGGGCLPGGVCLGGVCQGVLLGDLPGGWGVSAPVHAGTHTAF